MSTSFGAPGTGTTASSTTSTTSSQSERVIDVTNTSVGELLSSVTRDLSTLMRQEVALAKAEIRQDASRAGKGAGMLAGAAVAGNMLLVFLSIALWWALSHPLGHAWSALVVAVLWGIVAAVLVSVGRKNLTTLRGPQQTMETVKEIPDALKPNP